MIPPTFSAAQNEIFFEVVVVIRGGNGRVLPPGGGDRGANVSRTATAKAGWRRNQIVETAIGEPPPTKIGQEFATPKVVN